jgi:hypothetical protein
LEVTEESKPTDPISPGQVFEQASEQMRGMGEQAVEQMNKLGDQAGQMREFGEKAAEQARAFNEQILESATKVGRDAVDQYVAWLQTIAEEQRKLASAPQVSEMDWFASMLKAQADFTQEFAKMVGSTSFGRQPQG